MYWENIQGMFTFQKLYSNMINRFHRGSLFVEIGTFKGKSAVYMAEKMKDTNKIMNFFTIDIFESGEINDHSSIIDVEDLYKEVLKNIEPVKDLVKVIKGSSHKVHEQFEDNSVDFLFIDGCHSYDCVSKDLSFWFPKVKHGGVISGHDYNESTAGVKKAVDEFFKNTAQPYDGGCWYLEK